MLFNSKNTCCKLFEPAKLNSRAANLAIAIDWGIETPSTSKYGNCPNGAAGFAAGQSEILLSFSSAPAAAKISLVISALPL